MISTKLCGVIYFFLFSIGLVKIVEILSGIFARSFSYPVPFYEWVNSFYYPDKLSDIVFYILIILTLAVYFVIARWMLDEKPFKRLEQFFTLAFSPEHRIICLTFIFILNLAIFLPKNPGDILTRILVWVFFFTLPIYFPTKRLDRLFFFLNSHRQWIGRSFVIIVLLQFFHIFYPFVFQPIRLINDQWNIPESTYIQGTLVDNFDFLSQSHLLGSSPRYDLRTTLYGDSPHPAPTSFFQDKKIQHEFLDRNSFELHWQILNRGVIHHHNHILGPVNELDLGKDIHQTFMQYGALNTLFFKSCLNLLGGISYQNYFKVFYSIYYLYYLLFFLIIWILFKPKMALSLMMIISFSLNSMGFNFLNLGPGINPIRHFFDLLGIVLFYLYLFRRGHRYLILTYMVGLLGLANNTQTGLFFLGAVAGTHLLLLMMDSTRRNFLSFMTLFLALLASVFIYSTSKVGIDPVSHYFLQGLLGFPIEKTLMYSALFLVAFLYSVLLLTLSSKHPLVYWTLMLFLYAQGVFLYYVWGSDYQHFLVFLPILALSLFAFLKLALERSPSISRYQKEIHYTVLFVCTLFWVSGLSTYYDSKGTFDSVFRTHKTYQWDFDRARILSTMNPDYFRDSITLLQKYSPTSQCYILSKYDNFLPFLAKKYSAMPYFDVPMYLLTAREVDACIQLIKQDKPKFLFVDKDILRESASDIIPKETPVIGYLHDESLWRVQRLQHLKEIFLGVNADYKPVESSQLLTVYVRKNIFL